MDTNAENQAEQESGSINLSVLWTIFKRCWYVVILVGIAVGAAVGAVASYLYVPQYAASVSFLMKVDSSFQSQFQNSNISETIVSTYEVAFKHNREFCEKLNQEARTEEVLGYTASDVADMMSCEQILPNTPTLKVTFTCPNPTAAYNLAFKMEEMANDELTEQFGETLDAVDIFNTPEVPDKPVKGNPFLKMFAVGFLAGGLLTYLIFLLVALNDKRIHNEKSMEEFSGYPILGVVPPLTGGRSVNKSANRSAGR